LRKRYDIKTLRRKRYGERPGAIVLLLLLLSVRLACKPLKTRGPAGRTSMRKCGHEDVA